jgi:hypothetical protein
MIHKDGKVCRQQVLRKITKKCLTCFRLKDATSTQLMGQLSEVRVKLSRPFANSGVDYSGPFYVILGGKRIKTMVKCYVASCVCLPTKPNHLELVLELSTEACIASLQRFIARRGLRNNIYSDNDTNFVGAERELKNCF